MRLTAPGGGRYRIDGRALLSEVAETRGVSFADTKVHDGRTSSTPELPDTPISRIGVYLTHQQQNNNHQARGRIHDCFPTPQVHWSGPLTCPRFIEPQLGESDRVSERPLEAARRPYERTPAPGLIRAATQNRMQGSPVGLWAALDRDPTEIARQGNGRFDQTARAARSPRQPS